MRLELTTSPLPRECATTAPHGHIFVQPRRTLPFGSGFCQTAHASIAVVFVLDFSSGSLLRTLLQNFLIKKFFRFVIRSPWRTSCYEKSATCPTQNLPQATFSRATLPHGHIFAQPCHRAYLCFTPLTHFALTRISKRSYLSCQRHALF